jgi:DNA-binding transcriptional regulator GbsR (MarR family)
MQVNAILIERFGENATLGEMKSGTIAHMAFLQGRSLTISDLAKESGKARESISRWIERSTYVQLKEHPEDARSKLMDPIDLETMMAYLDLIIELENQ